MESAGHSLPPLTFLPDPRLEQHNLGFTRSDALSIRPRTANTRTYVVVIQVCEYRVQYCAYCILSAPIASVGKLVWVQCGWETFIEVCQDQSLKALHNNGCECYGMVVIQACWEECFGTGTMDVDLKHVGTVAWWGTGWKCLWRPLQAALHMSWAHVQECRRGQQPCVRWSESMLLFTNGPHAVRS